MVLELGEVLLLHLARDDGAVLERLAHLGLVADELVLLADVLGLLQDLLLFLVLDVLLGLVEAFLLQALLLLLERRQLGLDIRVDIVVDVLAIVDLGDPVVLPRRVGEEVVFPQIDVEHTGATVGLLDIPRQHTPLGVALVVLLETLDGVRNESLPRDAVHGLGNVDTGHDFGKTGAESTVARRAGLELLRHALGKQPLANEVLDVLHTILGRARSTQQLHIARLCQILQLGLHLGVEILEGLDIHLVENDEDHLVGEERLDRLEEAALGLEGVAALLTAPC